VTWEHTSDGNGQGIRYKIAELFTPRVSTPIPFVLPGNDLEANQITIGNQIKPSVTYLPLFNHFVIAWRSQSNNSSLVARIFNLTGPVNSDFIVAPLSGSLLGYPSVSSWSTGWILVWQDVGGMFVKTFRPNSNSQKLSIGPVGKQPFTPSIASSSFKSLAVIVWETTRAGLGLGIARRTFGCN
jgi:hypothetical protein